MELIRHGGEGGHAVQGMALSKHDGEGDRNVEEEVEKNRQNKNKERRETNQKMRCT
jgi:hypothetical protein